MADNASHKSFPVSQKDLGDLRDPGDQCSPGNYAVAASGLCKSFGKQRALDDLSIRIPRGTTYCLLGPNGSGKTTFIRSVVGLVRLDGGEMYILGTPLSRVREVYPKIGYMTQHKALYPDLTLQENMEFFSGLYGIYGIERSERITELLEMVELEEHRQRLTGALSGGMYQRLSLACTLIHEPDLLLLDEPTVGVDPALTLTFWEYFDELTRKGVTIIVTTHLMDEAERCDLVGFMRGGRLLAEGSPAEMKRLAGARPALTLLVDDLEGAATKLLARGFDVDIVHGKLQIRLDSHEQIGEILEEVRPIDLRLSEPSLRDAFLKLALEG